MVAFVAEYVFVVCTSCLSLYLCLLVCVCRRKPVGKWFHLEGSFLSRTSQEVDSSSFESLRRC